MPYNDTEFKESNVNYLNKDFSDIKKSLIDYAKSYFPNSYKDFNESSPGMMLIEMSAYVGDVLSFYIDQQYKEMMLPLAEERRNVLNMAKMMGYKTKPSIPAYVELTFTQDVNADTDDPSTIDYSSAINYNQGIQIQSSLNSDIVFETLEYLDFKITGSNDTDIIQTTNSDTQLAQTYRIERKIKAISGKTTTHTFNVGIPEKFLRLTLPQKNVIDIISCVDSNSNKWYKVDYLAQDKVPLETHYTNDPGRDDAYASLVEGTIETSDIPVPYSLEYIRTEKRFITEVNEDNTTSLIFGNGILKGDSLDSNFLQLEQAGILIPGQTTDLVDTLNPLLGDELSTLGEAPNNISLTITYRTGGGLSSNVPSSDLTKLINGESLTVTNQIPARGGKNQESIEEIRQNATANFSTQDRAVTKEDYEARILNMPAKYGGIAKVYVARSSVASAQAGLDNSSAFQNQENYITSADTALQNITDYIQSDTFIGASAVSIQHTILEELNSVYPTPDISSIEYEFQLGTLDVYILGYDNKKNLVGNPHAADLSTNDGVTLLMEQNIKNYLNEYKILTDVVNIQDGYIINFGVDFEVISHKYANKQEVKLKCIDKIKQYFHIDKMQFNQAINLSQLMYELMGVEGVRAVNDVSISQITPNNEFLYTYLYDGTTGDMSSNGTGGYGYKYDFSAADNGIGLIIPSNPLGTPSVFELKNPNNNIQGVVL
tara:strand:+ start:2714 stop:4858 length:2145 start_codon:yes stop_codon:yes gene_type:complete